MPDSVFLRRKRTPQTPPVWSSAKSASTPDGDDPRAVGHVQEFGDVDQEDPGDRLGGDPLVKHVDHLGRIDGQRAVDGNLYDQMLEFHR